MDFVKKKESVPTGRNFREKKVLAFDLTPNALVYMGQLGMHFKPNKCSCQYVLCRKKESVPTSTNCLWILRKIRFLRLIFFFSES